MVKPNICHIDLAGATVLGANDTTQVFHKYFPIKRISTQTTNKVNNDANGCVFITEGIASILSKCSLLKWLLIEF